jgi:hypothetical protein
MSSSDPSQRLGQVDDAEEEQEPASTSGGPAAEGVYDPAQGSPGEAHPTGEDFPHEATRYDDPDRRRPQEPDSSSTDADVAD